MDNLGQWGKAVGRTGSVGHNISLSLIILVVHAHHVHGGIAGGSRDDDLLGTATKVCLGLVSGGEDSSRLAHIGRTDLAPWDVRGVLLGEELDDGLGLTIVYNEGVSRGISSNGSGVLAVDRIVLEEVASVVEGEEGVVDGHGHDIAVVFEGGTADEAADAAESVDSKFDSHG